MKIKILAIIAIAFALISIQAQSTTNTFPPFNLAQFFGTGATTNINHALDDGLAFLENTSTTNGIIEAEAGVLYAEHSRNLGGFLNVYLPVGGTNNILGAGFGLAYLSGNVYDATLNARLGDTMTIPLIRIPVYAYMESGGGYDINKGEVIAQAFTGGLIKIPVTSTSTITIGGAAGTISDVEGIIIAAGLSYTFKPSWW